MRPLAQCLSEIPYASWLGLAPKPSDVDAISHQSQQTICFLLKGEEKHMGNPILRAWHGGVLAGSLQTAMSAAVMAANDLTEPPTLCEQTTRYVSSSPIDKPLTLEVRIVRVGKRVQFVEAHAWHEPTTVVATSQASFRGEGT